MSGRGNSNGGRGDRGGGRGGRGGRGPGGRGGRTGSTKGPPTGGTASKTKGLCDNLGDHVFTYGTRGSANQMRRTWKQIITYVGNAYSGDIQTELHDRTTYTIPPPTYSEAVLDAHRAMQKEREEELEEEVQFHQDTIKQLKARPDQDAATIVAISDLELIIKRLKKKASKDLPIILTGNDKDAHDSLWKAHTTQNNLLQAHRKKVHSLILGQIMPNLLGKLEQLSDWTTIRSSQDPLQLYDVIERTVLAQTEDTYPYAVVMDQMAAFCNFRQPHNLSAPDYFDKFNTRSDIGMTLARHPDLLNYVSNELYENEFDSLTDVKEKETVIADNAERFLAYVMIRHSGPQYANLRASLHEDYIQGSKRYPKKRSRALFFLEQATNMPIVSSPSKGTALAQKGGTAKKSKPNETNKWASKECNFCHELGHPAYHCPRKTASAATEASKDPSVSSKSKSSSDSDESSTSSKGSKSKIQKTFPLLGDSFAKLANEDLSDSDDDASPPHFQYQAANLEGPTGVTATDDVFKQSTKIDLDLRKVTLLDSQIVQSDLSKKTSYQPIQNLSTPHSPPLYLTMANPYTFPFKKIIDDKRMPSIKWQQANTKYKIHVKTLEDIDLSVLIPHCVETRAKIRNEVTIDGHCGPSLLSVFPRTLSTTLCAIWDQVVADIEEQTEEAFDAKMKEFIACHSTEEDRHELVQQLLQPVKPREVTVQAFYHRILELNEYVNWLPGDDKEVKLTPSQIKKALYDGMPRTWKDHFVKAGQSEMGMTTPEIVRYFRAEENLSISKQKENTQSQRRTVLNGNHNGKCRNNQHAAKPDEESRKKKPKKEKVESGNLKGPKRIAPDDPCPIHAGMNHTWGECYANAYNRNRQKEQGMPRDANKKANKKASKFAATAEKHADSSSDEDNSIMEIEGKILQSSCFTIETMLQLDNYLTSESCSCEQIEFNANV
jgi:hypothetical protein